MDFLADFFNRHSPKALVLGTTIIAGLLIFFYFQLNGLTKPRVIEIENSSSGNSVTTVYQQEDSTRPKNLFSFLPFISNEDTNTVTNFLLLGAAGEGNDAPDLTDTILVAQLNQEKNKIYLFSLPRDLFVKIPGNESKTKINALYAFGKKNKDREFNLIKQLAQEITGLEIDHTILVDLFAVKKIIDILGGVNIMVAKDIVDTSYPGPNHTFQTFEIKAGWRYLDGETALKYIRSRHSTAGDLDRIERQQDVLQVLKQKILALHFWNIGTFVDIYNAVATNVKSDLNLWQMKSYWDSIRDIPGRSINKNEIGTNFLTGSQKILGGVPASVLLPKAGQDNYEEIRNYIADIISQ